MRLAIGRATRTAATVVVLLSPAAMAAQHEGHGARPGAPPRSAVPRLATGRELGDITFPNSGARGAQRPFLLGVALLHNFEYDGAAEAFREAERADPRFALPYWLEAFSYSHIVWGIEDLAASRAALARLGPTPDARLARAPTPRERAVGAAVEALYADGPRSERIRAFADTLRRLAAADTADHEAAIFTAIALMSTAYSGGARSAAERGALLREASALAERVFAANPRHPGAAHFVIHANDDPEHAPRALAAARAYAKIAPASEHAQHMPSHIFVQLGYWDEAAATNERAWAASRAEVARRHLPRTELSWHTLSWLEYAYLQQGRVHSARSLLDSARTLLAGQDPRGWADARFAVPLMEFLLASSTGRWDVWTGSAGAPMPQAGAQPRAVGFTLSNAYWSAMADLRRGGGAAADTIMSALRAYSAERGQGRPPGAGLAQLEALAMAKRGARDSAIARLAEAAAAQDSAPPAGPPFVLPSAELLGAMLLDAERPREAAAAYERALRLCPNRTTSLLGLARARSRAGDTAGAAAAYRQLLQIWHRADADLPELAEARAGAAAGTR